MNDFKGMTTYTSNQVKNAIDGYQQALDRVRNLDKKNWEIASEKFSPSWWQRLWGVKTLEDYYLHSDSWLHIIKFAKCEGYLSDTVYRGDFADRFGDLTYWESEVNRLIALSFSQRDVYVTPKQSIFINKFTEYRVDTKCC